MTTASFEFLAFAALAAALYNFGRALWWRQSVLLVANLAFLTSFAPTPYAVAPLLCFVLYGYAAIRGLQSRRAERWFWAIVVSSVVIFFWLKRYAFVPAAAFLPFPYAAIGLSYIFFRVLHLIIDARDGTVGRAVGLIGYLNYTLNFTTLISGPIQRYQDFAAAQLSPLPPRLNLVIAGRAVERIIIGLFKTVLVAAFLSTARGWATADFAAAASVPQRAAIAAWLAASFLIYLYFNFSGYVDIVIGIARLLRLELPENFEHPFSAKNFLDFWRRWHITLSEWFRTYVYNPLVLALMKRIPGTSAEPPIASFGFFVTFFLIGLWHGQTWLFVLLGLLLGLGASGNKLYQVYAAKILGKKGYRALCANPLYEVAARGVTFTWLCGSLVCFWTNWDDLRRMGTALGSSGVMLALLLSTIGWGTLLWLGERIRRLALAPAWEGQPVILSRYVRTAWATSLALLAAATMALMANPAPDVVYKSF